MDVQFPGRAGKDAALLGPDPRARRRRLLSDVGHTVCAHRHRPRARVAAPASCRAGVALPQRPDRAPAERRRSDLAGGRPTGASRSHGARRADLRVPPVAHTAEDAGDGRRAHAVAAPAAVAAEARRAAAGNGHAPERHRARPALRACRRADAAPRRRARPGASPGTGEAMGRDAGRVRRSCGGLRRGRRIGSQASERAARARRHVRAGACLRRGAPRGAVLPPVSHRAVPDAPPPRPTTRRLPVSCIPILARRWK